jgi:hypothetical protein
MTTKKDLFRAYEHNTGIFISMNENSQDKLTDDEVLSLIDLVNPYRDVDIINYLLDTYANIRNILLARFASGHIIDLAKRLKVEYITEFVRYLRGGEKAKFLAYTLSRCNSHITNPNDVNVLRVCYLTNYNENSILDDIMYHCVSRDVDWYMNNVPLYPDIDHVGICLHYKRPDYVRMYLITFPLQLREYAIAEMNKHGV